MDLAQGKKFQMNIVSPPSYMYVKQMMQKACFLLVQNVSRPPST